MDLFLVIKLIYLIDKFGRLQGQNLAILENIEFVKYR